METFGYLLFAGTLVIVYFQHVIHKKVNHIVDELTEQIKCNIKLIDLTSKDVIDLVKENSELKNNNTLLKKDNTLLNDKITKINLQLDKFSKAFKGN